MKNFLLSTRLILSSKNTLGIFIFATLTFLTISLLIKVLPTALDILALAAPFSQKTFFIHNHLLDVVSSYTIGSFVLVVIGSVFGGLNLAFSYKFFKNRINVLSRNNLYSGTGLLFAFLGVGCGACGTALLSTLLGFFGMAPALNLLPYQGLEVGYLGIAILILATITLANKVLAPNVC